MRSADECLAKARELSQLAELSNSPGFTALILMMGEAWIDLSARAERHDSGKYAEALRAHRIGRP
jgi:hypothetical protein